LPEFREVDPFSGWLVFGDTSGEIPWDAAIAIGETEPYIYVEVGTERGERFFFRLLQRFREVFGPVQVEELNEADYL
jgi:hypothetical protein